MSRGPGKWDRLLAELLGQYRSFPLWDSWRLIGKQQPWSVAEYKALHRAVVRWEAKGECEVRRVVQSTDSSWAAVRLYVHRPGEIRYYRPRRRLSVDI